MLYLGAASGTTVSHVSDVVGPEGMVYAVEFSHRPGRDLPGHPAHRPALCSEHCSTRGLSRLNSLQ